MFLILVQVLQHIWYLLIIIKEKQNNKDFKKGKLSLVDGTTIVTNEENHTLYAIWEKE